MPKFSNNTVYKTFEHNLIIARFIILNTICFYIALKLARILYVHCKCILITFAWELVCMTCMHIVWDGLYMSLYVWDQKKISCWGLPSTFLGTEPHLCVCYTGLWASRDSIVATSCLTIGMPGYGLLYPTLHIVWGANSDVPACVASTLPTETPLKMLF